MSESKVGRPGKLLVELNDGSIRTFTREQWNKHLQEAITHMAANGKTTYDRETFDACKTQGETQRQHESLSPFGYTVANLLQLLADGPNGKTSKAD